MFKILVVEDDRELNRAVCAYLNDNGYETVGCLNADEAYDAIYGGVLFDMITVSYTHLDVYKRQFIVLMNIYKLFV